MEESETKRSADLVIDRMESLVSSLEQMSYDSINTTDRLVTLLNRAREYNEVIGDGSQEEQTAASEAIGIILEELLNTSFQVNNLSHQLEVETVSQRDTLESIRQMLDFLYSM
ncbi:MAG: hypothetical protein K2K70_03660 [Lachnospiraceae bacterium]|nr:hypothetical protein [Lachnospiraceae bacterium]